ncbi:MAG: glycoside hydrolase family 1 protein [Polyangiaceae bacterium]
MRLFRFLAPCAIALVSAVACSSSPKAAGTPDEVTFPNGFMWGSASAAFQVEKGDAHTDWGHWVGTAGKIKNGDSPDVGGPDAFAHFDDDIKSMKDSGQNAYRFSIEWGRIYPTRAAFDADLPDADAVMAYDTLLTKLKAAGMTPLVTLNHFALPDYLSDVTKPTEPQGWENQETTDLFVTFSSRMAKRWGDKVDWWVTINEPLVVVVTGYIQGGSPPGVVLDAKRGFAVAKAMVRAHAKAFDAIHAADTVDADGDGKAAWVSVAAHQRTFHPSDPTEPDDVTATEHVRYIWNLWFLNALVNGDWDEDLNGDLTGPDDKKADPALKGRLDYIGINYYSDTLISAHHGVLIPIINAAVTQDHLPTDRKKTDVAWDIYPEGFKTVLDEAKPYGVPVVVTENGIADRTDQNRARFLAEHIFQMGWSMKDGLDVRGYFHWSLLDNFEWQSGFCPKFGLASVDPATGARTVRGSMQTYKAITSANKVTQTQIAALPPYSDGTFCP